MIKKKARPALTDIDVGPFSDISFLLIIFFILTTQISAFKGQQVEVPSPSNQETKEEKEKKKQLTITLEGRFIKVGEDESIPPVDYTLEQLKALLYSKHFSSLKEDDPDRFVVVDANRSVPYETYFQVMMIIRQTGGIPCIVDSSEGGEGESTSSSVTAAAPPPQAVPAQ